MEGAPPPPPSLRLLAAAAVRRTLVTRAACVGVARWSTSTNPGLAFSTPRPNENDARDILGSADDFGGPNAYAAFA